MTADPTTSVSKTWSFTCNNYNEYDRMALDNLGPSLVNYLFFSEEVSPSGTPHFQGYLILNKSSRLFALKKYLTSRFHLEPSRKCKLANTRYCSKSGGKTYEKDYRFGRNIDYVTLTSHVDRRRIELIFRNNLDTLRSVQNSEPSKK